MRNKSALSLAVMAALAIGASGAAHAQDRNVNLNRDGSLYARLSAGGLMIGDIDFSSGASAQGITVNANGTITFDPGLAVSGAIGYRINRYFAVEGEFGYAQADYDQVEGNLTVSSGGNNLTVSGSADIDGDVTVLSGMVNLLATPFGEGSFRPHFGVGLGAVNIDESIDRVGTLVVNGSEDRTVFAASGILGFDFGVSQSVSVGARYRYLWIDSGENGVDNATAHLISATATIGF